MIFFCWPLHYTLFCCFVAIFFLHHVLLLCFIKPILGNPYFPGVSSPHSQEPKCTHSPLRIANVPPPSPCLHLNIVVGFSILATFYSIFFQIKVGISQFIRAESKIQKMAKTGGGPVFNFPLQRKLRLRHHVNKLILRFSFFISRQTLALSSPSSLDNNWWQTYRKDYEGVGSGVINKGPVCGFIYSTFVVLNNGEKAI